MSGACWDFWLIPWKASKVDSLDWLWAKTRLLTGRACNLKSAKGLQDANKWERKCFTFSEPFRKTVPLWMLQYEQKKQKWLFIILWGLRVWWEVRLRILDLEERPIIISLAISILKKMTSENFYTHFHLLKIMK